MTRQKSGRTYKVTPYYPPPIYEFTEFKTLHISEEIDLENDESEGGQQWGNIICTYAADPGTGLLYWGRLLETPSIVRLVIDWKSAEQQKLFAKSHLKFIQEAEKALTNEPVKTDFYVFPSWERCRENGFAKSLCGTTVCMLLIFHFPSTLDASQRKEFEQAWSFFSNCVALRPGGGASSGTCAGWSIDFTSLCGSIRNFDIPTAKKILLREESEGGANDDGLNKMKKLASGAMDVEFLNMYCLKDGWQGSVTRRFKEDPEGDERWAKIRRMLEMAPSFTRGGVHAQKR